jgi:hypothetical protein
MVGAELPYYALHLSHICDLTDPISFHSLGPRSESSIEEKVIPTVPKTWSGSASGGMPHFGAASAEFCLLVVAATRISAGITDSCPELTGSFSGVKSASKTSLCEIMPLNFS